MSYRDRGPRGHPPAISGLHSLKVDNISYHTTQNDLRRISNRSRSPIHRSRSRSPIRRSRSRSPAAKKDDSRSPSPPKQRSPSRSRSRTRSASK
uniref:Uncharacterized protein n=1 Tax=Panagrolaimus sp. ES5 TaxID=591445 RepID=A0AC34FTW9_9BILA